MMKDMRPCVFDIGNCCGCLTVKSCGGCRFRKTKEELERGRAMAKHRLETIPGGDLLIVKYHNTNKMSRNWR